jgi:hypothetical protein
MASQKKPKTAWKKEPDEHDHPAASDGDVAGRPERGRGLDWHTPKGSEGSGLVRPHRIAARGRALSLR